MRFVVSFSVSYTYYPEPSARRKNFPSPCPYECANFNHIHLHSFSCVIPVFFYGIRAPLLLGVLVPLSRDEVPRVPLFPVFFFSFFFLVSCPRKGGSIIFPPSSIRWVFLSIPFFLIQGEPIPLARLRPSFPSLYGNYDSTSSFPRRPG